MLVSHRSCFFFFTMACLLAISPSVKAQEELFALEQEAMKAAAQVVAPSVVRIETIGGLERIGESATPDGPTTGVIVTEDGYILSSAFNFVRQPTQILVLLEGERRLPARIVARDRSRMLVLLKVESEDPLPVPVAAPRDELRVGEWTVAVGRGFDAERPNLSVGIISALNRIWGKAVQTDAKISPANYGGPLVDLQGRIIGILVPMSPQGGGDEVSGAEWYDSGIGFAVPLADLLPRLETLTSGEDLHAGLVGISFQSRDELSVPPVLGVVHPRSPAEVAGMQVGDLILEIDGQPVQNQFQVKHALGPHYAGDVVPFVVEREGQRLEMQVSLTDEILPYQRSFLGILPERAAEVDEGVVVRYVYSQGPASELTPGDRIVAIEGEPVNDADALRGRLAALQPEETIEVAFIRDGREQTQQITLESLPEEIPNDLDPLLPAAGEVAAAVGLVELKIPEFPNNECFAYVPENYNDATLHGLLVYLPKPGRLNREAVIENWKLLCEERQLILLVPSPESEDRWAPTEGDVIRRVIDEMMGSYRIDRSRIVLLGLEAGGSMAYFTGFSNRDVVRGIAAVDASIPLGTSPPQAEPLNPLAFLCGMKEGSLLADRMEQEVGQLRQLKFPVTTFEVSGDSLSLSQREMIARWIDSLDRI